VKDHSDAIAVDFPEKPDTAQGRVPIVGDINPPHILDSGLPLTGLVQSDLNRLGPEQNGQDAGHECRRQQPGRKAQHKTF
jgi:hypothetical protein